MANQTTGKGLSVPRNPAMALRQLNRQHAPDTENDKQTDNQSNQQTNNTTILPTTTELDGSEAEAPENGDTEHSESLRPAAALGTPATHKLQTANQTKKPHNKPTKKQTNNTTITDGPPMLRRDGRTLRNRQVVASADTTIVTSFRIAASTMEALDEFCFRNRMRKQDVVQQALDAFIATFEDEA